MATYVKVAGTWRTVTTDSPSNGVCGYVKVNGTWRTVNQSYVKINGVWRSTCTAPGQQPAAIPETICYRPNYCLNGTNGVILPTTEPCYLADGVSLGTRTAPYTCQTDPGCVTYTVPAGVCTAPDPIIQVVSEEVGDCEFWGGISGCTTGYAKRVTKKYSDNAIKVSYSCCDPLQPNLKYYCTLRPFTTGTCLNELKDTDFTGTIVAGQGEWVCEALGTVSFPSCSTTENCTVPKTSSSTYEGCGYLSTGQRLVTTNTYQSWCETTQDTVIGECVGEIPKCGGYYCGEGSGEEEFQTSSCTSGTGIRYKCVTPEGCNTVYNFRRCIAPPPPPPEIPQAITRYTEICYTTNLTSSPPTSCRQFLSYTGPGTPGTNCITYGTGADSFIPCPTIPNENTGVIANCNTCEETYNISCITSSGEQGAQSVCVTPSGCEDIYGSCQAVQGGCNYCFANYVLDCDCPSGSAATYNLCITGEDCPNIETPCNCQPTGGPTGPTGPTGPNCSDCFYGSGTEACGNGGTRTYCITPVGCPDIYGACTGELGGTTPNEGAVSNPTGPVPTGPIVNETPFVQDGVTVNWQTQDLTDGGTTSTLVNTNTGEPLGPPLILPDLSFVAGAGGGKSINVNTLVRTRDGLVAAHDLEVGDKLLSADIATFPYDNLLATNIDLIEWTAQNPHINLVETEIVGLRTRVSQWAIIVDSDIFSDSHYILVNRNEVTKFVKAIDLESTDLIWSNTYHNWVSIGVLKKVDVAHEVVSIDCEPYDIFFTERMLTHDSNTVD
jgi:hypothetical protein